MWVSFSYSELEIDVPAEVQSKEIKRALSPGWPVMSCKAITVPKKSITMANVSIRKEAQWIALPF
jgi:hypothetical protein